MRLPCLLQRTVVALLTTGTAAIASAGEPTSILGLLAGYPDNLLPSSSSTRDFRYFANFVPANPDFDPHGKRFLIGVDYALTYQGTLIRRDPITGFVTAGGLPQVVSALMVNGTSGTTPPRWDGSDNAAYASVPTAPAFATVPTPPVSPVLRPTYSYTVHDSIGFGSGSANWIDDIRATQSTALVPRTDFLLRVTAPSHNEFVAAPTVTKAEVTYRTAEFFFKTQVIEDAPADCPNWAGLSCAADRISISAGVRTDQNELLRIKDAAALLGFDSLNYVNVITRTNQTLTTKSGLTLAASPDSPVVDAAHGGWVGQAYPVDSHDPYFNIVTMPDGSADIERGLWSDNAYRLFNDDRTGLVPGRADPDDATAMVFTDQPHTMVCNNAVLFQCWNTQETTFVTTLVGVNSVPCNTGMCIVYTPIGGTVFVWYSGRGDITASADDLGPITFQSLDTSDLPGTGPGNDITLQTLTFDQFEQAFGMQIDAYLAAATTPVPEPSRLALLLAGAAAIGLLQARRARAREAVPSKAAA